MNNNKNLYDVLNLSEEATAEEIKESYRDLSKKHHPDKGGDPEGFHEINQAYSVLSIPEKREKYDKTGDSGEPDNSFAEMTGLAVNIFMEAIGSDPGNVHEKINKIYKSRKSDLENQIKSAQKELEKSKKIMLRIKKFPENDFLGTVILSSLKDIEFRISSINEFSENLDKAICLLRGYEFTVEERNNKPNWNFEYTPPSLGVDILDELRKQNYCRD